MEILQDFFDSHMPYSAGFSTNTIQSYKYAFRLLIEYLYTEKEIPADKITFKLLDYTVISDYLRWLEEDRKCSVSTRNQRLAALSSFQNRDFEAAAIFMSSLKRLPKKKQKVKLRTIFTLDEVSVLLRLPDDKKSTGMRDKVLLNVMYASGARAQEICDLRADDAYGKRKESPADYDCKAVRNPAVPVSVLPQA